MAPWSRFGLHFPLDQEPVQTFERLQTKKKKKKKKVPGGLGCPAIAPSCFPSTRFCLNPVVSP